MILIWFPDKNIYLKKSNFWTKQLNLFICPVAGKINDKNFLLSNFKRNVIITPRTGLHYSPQTSILFH